MSFGLLKESIGCDDGYLYYSSNGELRVEKIEDLSGQFLVLSSGKLIDPRKISANVQRQLRAHFEDYHLRIEKANFFEKYGLRLKHNGMVLHFDVVNVDLESGKFKILHAGVERFFDLKAFDLQSQRQLYVDDKKGEFLDSASQGLGMLAELLKNPFDRLSVSALRSDFSKFDFDEGFMDLVLADPQLMHLDEFMYGFREVLMEDVLSVPKLIRLASGLLSKKSLFRGLGIYDEIVKFISDVVPKLDLIVAESKMRNLPQGFSAVNMNKFFVLWAESLKKLNACDREKFNDFADEYLKKYLNSFYVDDFYLDSQIDSCLKALEYSKKVMHGRFGRFIYSRKSLIESVDGVIKYLQLRRLYLSQYSLFGGALEDFYGKSNTDIAEIVAGIDLVSGGVA